MRVLLTGATGFVGRHVLTALSAIGCDVVSITSRVVPFEENAGIKWIHADLLREEACNLAVAEAKADVLIHMAWYAEHGKFWSAPTNFDWSRASINLFQAFIINGGSRAVFAGTCAEYDWRYGYCTEGVTPTEPSTVYGQCKDSTRRLTKALEQQSGVSWVWGRIFFPFGFGEPESRLLPSVIRGFLLNETVSCTHGRQFRDFVPVEEVASAIVYLACQSSAEGEFNISTGRPTAIMELVKFCHEKIGSDVAPQFGAIQSSPNEVPMVVGSCQKLIETGWRPGIDWREAALNMIKEYKKIYGS